METSHLPKQGKGSVQELFYIDAPGLERLFAQTGATTATKLVEEVSGDRTASHKLSPTASLSLFGISIGGGFEKSVGRGRGVRLSRESHLRPENHLADVRSALEQLGRLHLDLYSATNEAKSTSGSAFCDLQGIFRPFGWRESDDSWRLRANSDGFLLLELAEDPQTKVGMTLSKIVFGSAKEEIAPTGHLAMRLRRPISLRILGTVDAGRYIKPYAAAFL